MTGSGASADRLVCFIPFGLPCSHGRYLSFTWLGAKVNLTQLTVYHGGFAAVFCFSIGFWCEMQQRRERLENEFREHLSCTTWKRFIHHRERRHVDPARRTAPRYQFGQVLECGSKIRSSKSRQIIDSGLYRCSFTRLDHDSIGVCVELCFAPCESLPRAASAQKRAKSAVFP